MTLQKPNKPNVVVIGGGTGSFTLLQGLKKHPFRITALVNMADDGGSTGVLRDELGVLPPGDIRQCLVALSEASDELRELFTFRFPSGTFGGHSFGNIFLSAVESMTNDFDDAIRIAGDVLRINGRVLPITTTNCHLVLTLDGNQIVGQRKIEETKLPIKARPNLQLDPTATISQHAKRAILEADLVIIAPGNLYASIIPALLVDGIADALEASAAKVAYVCNLVNKPQHTAEFGFHDYADEIERFIGDGRLDYVLYNTDRPSEELLDRYATDDEYPVILDQAKLDSAHYMAIGGRFLSHDDHQRDESDRFIKRSLIRHDSHTIAKALAEFI